MHVCANYSGIVDGNDDDGSLEFLVISSSRS